MTDPTYTDEHLRGIYETLGKLQADEARVQLKLDRLRRRKDDLLTSLVQAELEIVRREKRND